ncbi:MAG: type I polyketide synthase, partial [Blastocatellia bacterium]
MKNLDLFDCQFFGVSPRAAQLMDPQQRLLLEVAWEALENANISADRLRGRPAGVFVGITCFDHAVLLSKSAENCNAHMGTSGALNMAPGRLSYTLGLTGPSLVLDTACSSSLVAIHTACQSLRGGESDLALAGGVHCILSPEVMASFSQAHMLAADGRCKTFDASADGYSRGEGCGVVVLQRLSDAVAGQAPILGVIRGSAVNQDGASGGLTVPNGLSQQEVMRNALRQAGISPHLVSYIEAHGTGTPLGDPIEVDSISKVYGQDRDLADPILVGSVKTNIGHLEPASGIAGLIKVLLAFRNRKIPRHLNCSTPNPHVPWNEISVKVTTAPVSWLESEKRRIAGISAFGFSGTNAHIVVEEPPPLRRSVLARRSVNILAISAKNSKALADLAASYIDLLDRRDGSQPSDGEGLPDFDALCHSAATGRSHFNCRFALVAESVAEARAKLFASLSGQLEPKAVEQKPGVSRQPRVGFAFLESGLNETLTRELYDSHESFRNAIDAFNGITERHPAPEPRKEFARKVAAAFALAQTWLSWGLKPIVASGEGPTAKLLAECLAGAIPIETVLAAILDASQPDSLSLAPVDERSRKIRVLAGKADRSSSKIDVWIEAGTEETSKEMRGVLGQLAALYERGAEIDWQVFAGNQRSPVKLPNYPFQRMNCGFQPGPETLLKKLLYTVEWEERALPTTAPAVQPGTLKPGDFWLILSDRGDCG